MPRTDNLKRSISTKARRTTSYFKILNQLIKNKQAGKFLNAVAMSQVMTTFTATSLQQAAVEVERSIVVLKTYKKMILNEKSRLEKVEEVIITVY